jgi:hypothetical protein
MPAFIPAQRLEAMFLRTHDRTIRFLVADRHGLLLRVRGQELDITEAIREGHLLVRCQVLSGEHQDGMLVEGLLHNLPGRGVHLGEGEVGDYGSERGIDPRDSWLHGIPSWSGRMLPGQGGVKSSAAGCGSGNR